MWFTQVEDPVGRVAKPAGDFEEQRLMDISESEITSLPAFINCLVSVHLVINDMLIDCLDHNHITCCNLNSIFSEKLRYTLVKSKNLKLD